MRSIPRRIVRPLLLLLAWASFAAAPVALAEGGGLREMLGLAPAAKPFLRADEAALTRARLAMLAAVRSVLAVGLGLLGVRPVEELH